MADAFSVRIHRFWTDYKPVKDPEKIAAGETHVATDWIEYEPLGGEPGRSVNRARIKDLASVLPLEPGSNDMAAMAANMRWEFIKPHYEAWKNGNSVPESGTPFAAWPGITPEQAQVLRSAGLRTVEELVDAGDSIISRIKLPFVRELQVNAKLYRDAADQSKVSAELAKKDSEIADLRAQLEELAELVRNPSEEEESPKRGRSRKEAA